MPDSRPDDARQPVSNFRPVAGMPAGLGRHLKDGVLFRSEAIVDPDPADEAMLRSLDIALVCDLRSAGERESAPNRWWRDQGADVLDLDILASLPAGNQPWDVLRAAPDADGARAAMRAVYAAFPAAARDHVAALVRRIGQGGSPVLVHCTAGKDRTGFVVAALLAALGVPRDVIIADYLESRGRRTDRVAQATRTMMMAKIGIDLSAAALDVMLGVEEEYLLASFAAITAQGGIDSYFRAAGLERREVAALRERLLV